MLDIRIEIPATRDEAKKIVALYQNGSKHGQSEEMALEEAWRKGWTPSGRVRFAGITNGQPPNLKYDVAVYPDIEDPR